MKYFFSFLQFENVKDTQARQRMNILHQRNIVDPVLQLPENAEEIYPKNPSKSLKSGFMIIDIMRILAMEKRLLLLEKRTLQFCKFATGSLMLEGAFFPK